MSTGAGKISGSGQAGGVPRTCHDSPLNVQFRLLLPEINGNLSPLVVKKRNIDPTTIRTDAMAKRISFLLGTFSVYQKYRGQIKRLSGTFCSEQWTMFEPITPK